VDACERIGAAAYQPAPLLAPARRQSAAACDVSVLGGTGFIGAHVVRRLVAQGTRVAVMARSVRNLPAVFADPLVTVHAGDLRDATAVARAIGQAPVVVNLAHGGGGATWEAVRDAMVGGAETVARACLEQGVRRLIHIGSIASLYLGPQERPVTGATPPDPQAERRADYARAKAMTDAALLAMHRSDALPVCILRPGLVVGEGGLPFHSGLGFFNNEQYCIGWNNGRNKLPFVLVEDVADAILLALHADGIDGRCYNLVGDVRPSAREYIAALGAALQRPLHFHPQVPRLLWLGDVGKFLIKRATGRGGAPPSMRDLLSRGLTATFDCSDARQDLGWSPVADPARFRERAILVHAG
jgi:nucleoside-diphosphate-sugar epimerase